MKNERIMTLEEKWESLTLADNFMFCKIMSSDLELCRELLETLLQIEIGRLELANAEETMRENFDTHGVRLDVYTKDEKRIFDIEIQTTKKKNLVRRARYYQSVIDIDNLPAGADYDMLKDTYIIFLCLDDIFEKGRPVYTFENFCAEDKEIKLNDGCHKIFFNASACDKIKNVKTKEFFKLLRGMETDTDTDFTNRLKDKISFFRHNIDWRRQYMVWALALDEAKQMAREEAREEGLAEGRAEGAREKSLENARNAIRLGLSAEQTAEITGLTLEEVLAIKA